MIMIQTLNSEQKNKLFSILTNLGFKRTDMDDKIIFKLNDEVLVYPNGELWDLHFFATRKHLDENGRMNSSKFNKIMKYE